jgi:ECF sigma factor
MPASYGRVDEVRAGHCHGWSSEGDRWKSPKLLACVNSVMHVLCLNSPRGYLRVQLGDKLSGSRTRRRARRGGRLPSGGARARAGEIAGAGGLSVEDAGRVLGISRATADRYWAYARVWLFGELSEGVHRLEPNVGSFLDAPAVQIILVEADSQSLSDLIAGVATAAMQPGVSVVSRSWGFAEGQAVLASDESAYDRVFTTPGVTFVAGTGDYGAADPEYRAYSPNVVAVGGTSLALNQDGSYNSETGWFHRSDSLWSPGWALQGRTFWCWTWWPMTGSVRGTWARP